MSKFANSASSTLRRRRWWTVATVLTTVVPGACGVSGPSIGRGSTITPSAIPPQMSPTALRLPWSLQPLPAAEEVAPDGTWVRVKQHYVAALGLPALDEPAEAVRYDVNGGRAILDRLAAAIGVGRENLDRQSDDLGGAIAWHYDCTFAMGADGAGAVAVPAPTSTAVTTIEPSPTSVAEASSAQCAVQRRPTLSVLLVASGLASSDVAPSAAASPGEIVATKQDRDDVETALRVVFAPDGTLVRAFGSIAKPVLERRTVARAGTAAVIAQLNDGRHWARSSADLPPATTVADTRVFRDNVVERTLTIDSVRATAIDADGWFVPAYEFSAGTRVLFPELALAPTEFEAVTPTAVSIVTAPPAEPSNTPGPVQTAPATTTTTNG